MSSDSLTVHLWVGQEASQPVAMEVTSYSVIGRVGPGQVSGPQTATTGSLLTTTHVTFQDVE